MYAVLDVGIIHRSAISRIRARSIRLLLALARVAARHDVKVSAGLALCQFLNEHRQLCAT
jgi:hypothetical protein